MDHKITKFTSVRSVRGRTLEYTFDQLADNFVELSEEPMDAKENSNLFAPTHFLGGYRKKDNAKYTSLIVLDIDEGISFDDVRCEVEDVGLSAILCTTASSKPDHHKFRVIVPLSSETTYEDAKTAWFGLNFILTRSRADTSKIGCESLFYLPGDFRGAYNAVHVHRGDIPSVTDIVTNGIGMDTIEEELQKLGKATKPEPKDFRFKREANDMDVRYRTSGLISYNALRAYECRENYHIGRYRMLCSIAASARRRGILVTAAQVADLFMEFDARHGDGRHQTSEHAIKVRADAISAMRHVN